ncbi:hypothetical protein FSARC_5208 [Fusarium sarcochroum]|uniref:Uncharacterized protein n=1 Tax=Fusarium sarcochroum TaxID=1208366 RepID=A0A8H4U021_9HYPO|nr:hypothetical protein FSARC_5208 [Fusarium sarcochroum]
MPSFEAPPSMIISRTWPLSQTAPLSFECLKIPITENNQPDAVKGTKTLNRAVTNSNRGSWDKLKVAKLQILINILALSLLSVVVVFIQATYSAQLDSSRKVPMQPLMKVDVSTTLTVVRAAQGMIVSLFGISLISGLVLFFNTSLVTVYDTSHKYNVTAGVGPFNGSLVPPFMRYIQSLAPEYPYHVLPYTYYAAVYALVANPLVSTVIDSSTWQGDDCISYLLSGGLSMVAPWIPVGHEGYPMVKIDNVTSIQLDFTERVDAGFKDTDCNMFGQKGTIIGVRLCVAQGATGPGSLRAGKTVRCTCYYPGIFSIYHVPGLFVCENGTDGDACSSSRPASNLTTTVTFYTRRATVIVARSNYSIINIAESTVCQFNRVPMLQLTHEIKPPIKLDAIDIPA